MEPQYFENPQSPTLRVLRIMRMYKDAGLKIPSKIAVELLILLHENKITREVKE